MSLQYELLEKKKKKGRKKPTGSRGNESPIHSLMHRTRGIALHEALLLSFMCVFTALAEVDTIAAGNNSAE